MSLHFSKFPQPLLDLLTQISQKCPLKRPAVTIQISEALQYAHLHVDHVCLLPCDPSNKLYN